jgi:hypothetical protein
MRFTVRGSPVMRAIAVHRLAFTVRGSVGEASRFASFQTLAEAISPEFSVRG